MFTLISIYVISTILFGVYIYFQEYNLIPWYFIFIPVFNTIFMTVIILYEILDCIIKKYVK